MADALALELGRLSEECDVLTKALGEPCGTASDLRKLGDVATALQAATDQVGLRVDGVAADDEPARALRKDCAEKAEALSARLGALRESALPAVALLAAQRWAAAAFKSLGSGDFAGAKMVLDEAIQAAPDDADLWLSRAKCFSSTGDFAAAALDARQATRVDVNNRDAWHFLAQALLSSNDLPGAVAAIESAPVAMQTSDDEDEDSDDDEDLDDFDTLRRGALPDACKNAANALFKAGSYTQALELYSLAVRVTRSQQHVYLSNRSACLQALKRWREAAADAQRVMDLEPAFAKGYLHYARSSLQLGKFADAADALKIGVEELEANGDADSAVDPLRLLLADVERRQRQTAPIIDAAAALKAKAAECYKGQQYREVGRGNFGESQNLKDPYRNRLSLCIQRL
ncbi:hypothetical protein M885DRAFT_190371 [Pelagophyceae sp. CCMP2097]|nr:hypothetical protein M885DRAFT_190371 [Pelagophyceae sp. CCMP2097]